MKFVLSVFRSLYQILAGLCMALSAVLLASLAWEIPFARNSVRLDILGVWTDDPKVQLGMGIAAVVLAIGLLIQLYLQSRLSREEPSLAFDNPDGEVSISIQAIEDFVRRIGSDFDEIKTLSPKIVVKREGVEIVLKVELWSEPNIPKLTERVQNVVKSQVQNILGIENVQSVSLSVSKIIAREKDYQMPAQSDIFSREKSGEPDNREVSAPYHGSGADY